MIEQSAATRRRILAAHIPPRLAGMSLLHGEQGFLKDLRATPPGLVSTYVSDVLSGAVVAATGCYNTCGRGIWATKPRATEFVTALMRDFMVLDGFTGLYVNTEDYLESMRPDRDAQYSDKVAEVSFMVLAYAGQENMTDWTRSTIRALLMKRYEAGLPTLVSATVEPSEYLTESLADSMFVRIGIMEESW